jgi:hypothetical protein
VTPFNLPLGVFALCLRPGEKCRETSTDLLFVFVFMFPSCSLF